MKFSHIIYRLIKKKSSRNFSYLIFDIQVSPILLTKIIIFEKYFLKKRRDFKIKIPPKIEFGLY